MDVGTFSNSSSSLCSIIEITAFYKHTCIPIQEINIIEIATITFKTRRICCSFYMQIIVRSISVNSNETTFFNYNTYSVSIKDFQCIASSITSDLHCSKIIIITNIHISNDINISMCYICINTYAPFIIDYHASSIKCKNLKCITTSIILHFQTWICTLISYFDIITTQKSCINCHVSSIYPKITRLQ